MSRTATHPLFFVPAFLLFLSMTVFGYIEYRMEKTGQVIRDIASDPELLLSSQIQDNVWSFSEAISWYIDIDRNVERYKTIKETHLKLHTAIDALETYLHKDDEESDAHRIDLEILSTLQKETHKIGASVDALETLTDPAAIRDFRKSLILLVEAGHALSRSIIVTRQSEFAEHTDSMARDERIRTLLLVLDLVLASVLVGALFRNVIRTKRNMELAWATERYNAFYAAALQSIRVGVLIRDMQRSDLPVLFVNNAFTELTGYDLAFMADKKSDILFGWHTDSSTADAFRNAIKDGKSRNFDILIYRKNGSSFWCDWHVSPVCDKEGKLTHYISLLTDITSVRQTQEALLLAKQQAEHASAVKTSFLATMSHEIRTPINGLLGVLDLLGETQMNKEQARFLQIAQSSSQSLHSIINDILDYSKLESGKVELMLEKFNLADLTQSVVDLADPVAVRKGLALKTDLQSDLPSRFEGDPGKIRQIALNLVMNAIKFTDQGSVTIRIQHLMTQEKMGQQVALLRFEIIDTGIGISGADQDKLFREFSQVERSFTRRFGGTGLGLAISKRLVTMMGGEIGLESKPGQGSTFWFMLPLAILPQADAQPQQAESDKSAILLGVKAVLLVEDNETNQLVASRYMQKAGVMPDIVSSGQESIDAAGRKTYDLIFMDISMSDMDGFETTRRLRAMGGWLASVPIIALTAHVMPGDRERCLAAGMNDHLEKPLNYTSLLRMLNRWLPAESSSAMAANALVDASPEPQEDKPQQTAVQDQPKGDLEPLPLCDKPDLDPAVLQQLADDLGADAVLKITALFLNDSQKRLDEFPKAKGDVELSQFGNMAHTLKSSAASCGLMRFSARMAAIEAAAAEGKEDYAYRLLEGVAALYQAGRDALQLGRDAYQVKK